MCVIKGLRGGGGVELTVEPSCVLSGPLLFMLFKVLTHDCPFRIVKVTDDKSVVAPNSSKDEAVYNGGGTADELVSHSNLSLNFDKTKEMVVDLPRRLTANTHSTR